MTRKLPGAATLGRAVYSGWACVWCGRGLLNVKARLAGRAVGSVGATVLDVDVYECASGGCAELHQDADQTGVT